MTKALVQAMAFGLLAMAASAPVAAQDAVGRPGWTFTPSFGFSETYDDNITLSGVRSPLDEDNNDLITTYVPGVNLTYGGRRTRTSGGYSGGFLAYRTYSLFNRWDQRAFVSVSRTETPRFTWSADASLTKLPSTEALELEGVPFSHTGSTALNGRATIGYRLGERDSITSVLQMQRVEFERPGEELWYLRGGRSTEGLAGYRRGLNERTGLGANYTFRRAMTIDDDIPYFFHAIRAEVDHTLSPFWKLTAAAGFDFVMATVESPAEQAPGYSVAAERNAGGRRLSLKYQRQFLPSFGFGGTFRSHAVTFGYHTPLFHSRYFYLDAGASLRDSKPLLQTPYRLPLRAFSGNASFGWAPRPWVQLEAFYARAEQSTLVPGGRLDRNRVGVRIVTSAPMRVQ